ncbi:MAG TPA: glycosyltransferase family 87 protein [Ktedonobacteraceae bacterium]|nr:glycosyltransferase family 87 protein [Ktedonobacteraceae bacterium]
MIHEEVSEKQAATAGKNRPFITFCNALVARKGIVAYLPIIIVIVLMFFGASWQFFWTHTDGARYECYALTYWLGSSAEKLLPAVQCAFLNASSVVQAQPPFHMLPLEYPPLTVVIFSLALIAPLYYYQLLFAVLMALMTVLIYWLLLRYAPRGAGLAFAIFMLIGAWATAQGRFDLVPAALTLLCLIAAERKHWTAAYIALAFGFLLKIYPILFLPALFIAEQHDAQRLLIPPKSLSMQSLPRELAHLLRGIPGWRWKNTLIFFAVIVGITGFFALFDFQGAVVSQLSYFANRPVQAEATGSTLLWIGTQLGFPVHVVYTYGSVNLVSALGQPVSLLFDVLLVLGYVYTIWLQWRSKMDVVQAFIAILLVFIVTGKVFSPQYLIWIIPLLVYSGAYNRFWILTWVSISLLTTLIYPYFYLRTLNATLAPYVPGFIPAVALRDALLLLLTLAYLFNWFQARHRKPLPAPLTGKETRPLTIS